MAAGDANDIDVAVKAASRAYKTSWGLKTPGQQRGRLLYLLADLIEKNADAIAAAETIDAGAKFLDTMSP